MLASVLNFILLFTDQRFNLLGYLRLGQFSVGKMRDNKRFLRLRRFNKLAQLLANEDLLRRPSIETIRIWELLIMKDTLQQDNQKVQSTGTALISSSCGLRPHADYMIENLILFKA